MRVCAYRRGIGSALRSAAIQHARNLGFNTLIVEAVHPATVRDAWCIVHVLSQSHNLSRNLFISLSLSLSHTHTHNLSLSLSLTQTRYLYIYIS